MKTQRLSFKTLIGSMGSKKSHGNTFDSLVNGEIGEGRQRKRHGIYMLAMFVRGFVFGPKREQSRDHDAFSKLAEQIIVRIDSEDADKAIIEYSEALLRQQRMLDDTRARSRLEKWTRKAIAYYLSFVAVLVVVSKIVEFTYLEGHPVFSDLIWIVILSTTTINILGLGYIVLRGHFPDDSKTQLKFPDKQH